MLQSVIEASIVEAEDGIIEKTLELLLFIQGQCLILMNNSLLLNMVQKIKTRLDDLKKLMEHQNLSP